MGSEEEANADQQLLILNRGRKRAPNLRAADRFIAGVCTLFIRRARLLRSAIVLKPSTLLHLHRVLIRRKYRLLFSPTRRRDALGNVHFLASGIASAFGRGLPLWSKRVKKRAHFLGERGESARCRNGVKVHIRTPGSSVRVTPWSGF
jgi:hypothetical protein